MTTNIKQIPETKLASEIEHYKEINYQLKVLEAEKARLKEALVKSYFESHEEYVNKDGLVIASYKSQIREIFDTKEFKETHPNLYSDYTHPQEIHVFLVK